MLESKYMSITVFRDLILGHEVRQADFNIEPVHDTRSSYKAIPRFSPNSQEVTGSIIAKGDQ